jgi:hypothetical protein
LLREGRVVMDGQLEPVLAAYRADRRSKGDA